MGNADSQSSFVPPPKSSSFRCSSRRDEVPSARSWWKTNRSQGRSHVNQPASWKYDPAPNLRASSQLPVQFGGGINGTSLPNGGGGGSPKVLLSKDGSMRVEFTNSRVAMETQVLTTSSGTVGAVPDPSLRTSKGSSLSSDGSWYDSPWGNGGELSDNVFVCGQSVDNSNGFTSYCSTYNSFFSAKVDDISPGGYSTCCSGRTEDSGIGDSVILQPEPDFSLAPPVVDVYTSHSSPPAFPTSPELLQQQRTASASSSSAPLDDVILEEEGAGGSEQHYSSCTLPCRRAESSTSSRKDFLKSRIQRLSDWTGSLSRKKRRIQEPCSGDTGGDFFNTKLDSSRFWSCNPLQNQFTPVYFSSSRSLNQNQSSDVQRQNIYENFMQELEPRRSSTDELSDASEENEDDDEEEEEEEEDMEEEVGRGQQMEVLFERDQGVVRRAGWLSFKALLTLNKDLKLEPVARRKWRHYWVTLKGCTLLFYETYGRSGGADVELSPRYALQADDSIVQAVPEHPKKEHVFCLSNAHGDVYLFQATNQTDLENWVTSIHSASASRLAKRQGKDDTVRLLRSRSRSLLHKIDMDAKMKKMAELQLSVIKEQKNQKAVETQIQQWEQNLEKLNLDLFRTRCYLSSLQGGELPNPKGLLAVASRPSKSMLGRLGVFSVSSLHALVCSRDEATLRRRCQSSSGGCVRRRGHPSSLKVLIGQNGRCRDHAPSVPQRPEGGSRCVEVAPPGGRSAHAQVRDEQTFSVFTLQVCRPDGNTDFGFAVTGHVDGSGQTQVFISDVDPGGPWTTEGLRVGDQVLAVDGSSVSGLDLDLMQSVFSRRRLDLLLQRDRSHDYQEPAPCHPADPCPPLTPVWTPAPSSRPLSPPGFDDTCPQDTEQMSSLYQTFPECRAADVEVPKNPYSREAGLQPVSPAHLSVCQRLRKVIEELVDTEKSYVKDLVGLFDLYLTPLQQETFLSKDEMEALFGSLPEMLDFQRVFLQTLEERIASCPNLSSLETPEQFKKLLFSLGGSFLYYADHFKLYSGFCANHIKVQKVLERAKTDGAFKHFLEARNPTNQHSSSLESYLIKPVQRVLKYPLLLRELVSLTDPESQEHAHLTEALRAMEKVATHINEMQKIYEDYGCVFDQLTAEVGGVHRQVTEVSMGEFLVQSAVLWLNPVPSLGRLRKEPELTLFVFQRAVILIYRDNKLKKRMTASRSADLDPFRFRWLIPVSAVQVRPADITGAENPCTWELVHSRSESEGRPETVFQLCSSGLDSKAVVLRALRTVLRDHAPSTSLRRSRPSTAERRRRQQRRRHDAHRTVRHHGNSRRPSSETCSEPPLSSHAPSAGVAERGRSRLCSLTGDLEAQLQRLKFNTEEEEEEEEERKRRSLLELSGLLERDYSVHSMASIINEDCFYDNIIKHNTAPALQGHG